MPARREPPKPKPPPEFVRNVVGSSAAAGSAEFHIFRNNRRKEMNRLEYIEKEAITKELDEEFERRNRERREMEEARTARKRLKRQKKKEKMKRVKKSKKVFVCFSIFFVHFCFFRNCQPIVAIVIMIVEAKVEALLAAMKEIQRRKIMWRQRRILKKRIN